MTPGKKGPSQFSTKATGAGNGLHDEEDSAALSEYFAGFSPEDDADRLLAPVCSRCDSNFSTMALDNFYGTNLHSVK
ncbi:unnamed protein product [Clonostachys rosea]|uniref:Uncharacterized protein n=1 Tax=Bionectria ochroleuca TaxID=29856 RepID=A0ABY6V3A8_BIOOC|nr:unnamed protein product [Clonostachys rosea]